MEKGKIIYLNGVSGTGKTTLSKTLQERLDEPFYWVASDVFCSWMAPKKFWSPFDILSLLFHTVKHYSDIGINSIVDVVHTQQDIELLDEGLRLLNEYPVLFVHVTCPVDELHRRKTERGDPEVDKWLPYQLEKFTPKEPYDITVDTHNETIEECADRIIALINYPEKCKAFKTLWSQRTE